MKQFINRVVLYATILTLLVGNLSNIYAQENIEVDSSTVYIHSPKRATYLALVPGLGQIYNKKYWKLPIVYSGFAVIGYFAVTNRREYIKFNDAYIASINNTNNILIVSYDPENDVYVSNFNERLTNDELVEKYDKDQLKSARDYYRRNMELSFIVMGAWYILQIFDASVDAHLYYWEVNDDLSVRAEPVFQLLPVQSQQFLPTNNTNYNGLKITVKF